jgi:gliding motility-associated lipoprotein GldB
MLTILSKTYCLLGICIVLLFFTSCTSKEECRKAPEVKPLSKEISIVRMENKLFRQKDAASINNLLNEYPDFKKGYLGFGTYPEIDKALMQDLMKLVNDPFIDTLNQEVAKTYPSILYLNQDIYKAFSYLKHYYPTTKVPHFYTMVSGFSSDLTINDSLVVIGLDAFQGGEGKYTMPTNMVPMYIQRRMKPQNIVPAIIMAYSRNHVVIDDSENTLLSNMIQWGKTYYFMEQMLPCVNDSILIGFHPEEIKSVEKNITKIWGHFVKQNLFYETNHLEVNRYIGERPSTPEIGKNCPGRIGRYIGWMVVREYAKNHPEISFQQLMADEDANKIFTQSKYKP